MRIKAQLREMAASELAAMIPSSEMMRIQATDAHPHFKAFVVGHEGEASGNMVGVGNVVKRWFRSAIEKLHDRIQVGIQLFHSHGATNEHAGREPIGEVVGKRAMNIGDRLSAIVACYIYPAFRHLPLDVASIEANVVFEHDRLKGLYVAEVDEVTGIALGHSSIEKPGFPGATLLGQLQAFVAKERYMGKPTAEEIRQLIREAELQPSDIFTVGEITADPIVTEQAREKNVSSPQVYYELREHKRLLAEAEKRAKDAEKTSKDLTDQIKAKDDAIRAGAIEAAKAKVPTLFEKQKATRKLDAGQTKYIQSRLARFTPTKAEDVEKEFETYLDSEVDEFGKVQEILGVKPKGENKKGGIGPEDNSDVPGPDKYITPATNPMIKTDPV